MSRNVSGEMNNKKRKKLPAKDAIHSADFINRKYHVDSIFPNKTDRINITDRLQMTDWFAHVINGYESGYEGCDRMVLLYALINVMSVIEAMMQEAVQRCHDFCKETEKCDNCESCRFYYKEGDEKVLDFKEALASFRKHGLLKEEPIDQFKELKMLYSLRNGIHVRQQAKMPINIPVQYFDIAYYNNLAMENVGVIADICQKEMVPYYGKCRGYEELSTDMELSEKDAEEDISQEAKDAEYVIWTLLDSMELIAWTDDDIVKENIRMARGGMSEYDRTITKSLAEYLICNSSYLIYFMMFSKSFREICVVSIADEIRLDDMEEEERFSEREYWKDAAAADFPEDGVNSDPFEECYTIDLNRCDYGFVEDLSKKMKQSYEEIGELLELEYECIEYSSNKEYNETVLANGYIFSNWMYFIRAFSKNAYFQKTVISMIDDMKDDLKTEYEAIGNLSDEEIMDRYRDEIDKLPEKMKKKYGL